MRFFPLLAFTDGGQWRPGIGDPTFIGWLTVIAYGVAAFLCLREAYKGHNERSRMFFWAILGTLMVVLGVNKQLDLQTWLTLTGRKVAKAQGWYDDRRTFQVWFIFTVALGGLLGCASLWRLVQEHGSDLQLSLVGIFVVTCFVIIRAASFHHIDQFLHTRLAGFKMNWLLELGGIILIIAGALRTENDRSERSELLRDA